MGFMIIKHYFHGIHDWEADIDRKF